MLKTTGNISGLLSAVSIANARAIETHVDDELGKIADELADKISKDAPVLTGALRDSLKKSAYKPEKLTRQIVLDLENVPYTWRQNFEHRSKRYFITRNVNVVDANFEKRLQEAVNNANIR